VQHEVALVVDQIHHVVGPQPLQRVEHVVVPLDTGAGGVELAFHWCDCGDSEPAERAAQLKAEAF
jgi:hypothetical protein